MLSQQIKDVYFLANRWAALPNHYLARLRFGSRRDLRLHLGCGPDYIDGMLNIDGNIRRRCDLWLDLRNGLPFPADSTLLVYCSHTLEHLLPNEAIKLLKEVHRVLRPDGIARIAVPSVEHAMRIMAGDAQSRWPRDFDDPTAQAINYLFAEGQHKYAYSDTLLRAFARQAGFTRIHNFSAASGCAPKRYDGVELGREPGGSLIFELQP